MHGDCLVPSRYEANLKLGKWVETQRYEYTKLKRAEAGLPVEKSQEEKSDGKPRATNARLTEERLRRLESIGFEWKVRNKMKRYYDKQWQDMFDLLLDFKAKNGHTMVPKRYPENPRLANWVHTQRVRLWLRKNAVFVKVCVSSTNNHFFCCPRRFNTVNYRLVVQRKMESTTLPPKRMCSRTK